MTGKPGVGKSTLLKRVIEMLQLETTGFCTLPYCIEGISQGFYLYGLTEVQEYNNNTSMSVQVGYMKCVGISEIFEILGAEDQVVGLEMKADTREIYKKAAPQFLELPGIGTSKTINVEEVLVLNPDLVIISYRLKEFIPGFEALNIPVIGVEPESLENFLECVELVGQTIGEEEKTT